MKDAARFQQLPLLFGKGAPMRAEELLRLVAGEPDLAARVTGARLVGERRWDVYLDGRIEVRLPAERPEVAWRRLAAEQRASEVIERAITAVDLRNPGLADAGAARHGDPAQAGRAHERRRGVRLARAWSAAAPGVAAPRSACSTSAPASSAATSPARGPVAACSCSAAAIRWPKA